LWLDVAEGRRDAALRHHRVGFPEERLANEPDVQAHGGSFDGCAQTGAPCADDDDIVFVRLVAVCHQRILTSWLMPVATRRTYTSAPATAKRLVQANSIWFWFKRETPRQSV